jgi:hypothetical protein
MPRNNIIGVPNPHVAFAWLWIGGVQITVDDMTGRPRHLESFSFDLAIETLGTFEFTLFDPDYDAIEKVLMESGGKCKFKFGYTTGAQSPTYEGLIIEYVPKFLFDGIRVHIKGFTLAINGHKSAETHVWKDKKIHEIVGQIATDHGWKSDIDECIPVEQREDGETSDLKDKTWQQSQSDLAFITEKLQKQAVRKKDKAGGYVLYFDPEKTTLHFHPPRYEKPPVKTFVWRSKYSEIITFTPQYSGLFLAALALGGSARLNTLDMTTTEMKPTVKSDKTRPDGDKASPADPAQTQGEKPDNDDPQRSTGVIYKAYPDEYFGLNEAKFWWYRAAWLAAFRATLEVVGDPDLKPWEKYEIQVGKKYGGLHWTSGKYWANGITHTIESGEYHTTLKLWRDHAKGGTDPSETYG